MLSLNYGVQVERDMRPIEVRWTEQLIAEQLITQEQFDAVVEAFNREHIDMVLFWNYIRAERTPWADYGVTVFQVSDLIASVITDVEEFNRLLDADKILTR